MQIMQLPHPARYHPFAGVSYWTRGVRTSAETSIFGSAVRARLFFYLSDLNFLLKMAYGVLMQYTFCCPYFVGCYKLRTDLFSALSSAKMCLFDHAQEEIGSESSNVK